MTLVKYNPFRPFGTTISPHLLDDFFGRSLGDFLGNEFLSVTPSVNIVEEDELYRIEVAAPGLQKDNFNISVKEDRLTISTSKKEESEEKDDEGNFKRREFNYSSFSRSFHLTKEIDQEEIVANYQDGILAVTLRKNEDAKDKGPKTIEIA